MRRDTRKLKVRRSEWDENEAISRFYCRPIVLEYRKRICVLAAGLSDHTSLHYYDRDHTLVLTHSCMLPYVGAELIDLVDMKVVHEVFFQDGQVEETLGKKFMDLSDCRQAEILSQWFV